MEKFISLRSRKQKMVASSGSEDSALEELIEMVRCWTGGARDDLAEVGYGCPGR